MNQLLSYAGYKLVHSEKMLKKISLARRPWGYDLVFLADIVKHIDYRRIGY